MKATNESHRKSSWADEVSSIVHAYLYYYSMEDEMMMDEG
jgi:hypothetical protein